MRRVRYAYNFGLRRKIEAFKAGQKTPTAIDLHRELNALKKTELGWMYEVSKCAPQEALRNLDRAFDHFFRRVREKKAGKPVKVGYPRFKSKNAGAAAFVSPASSGCSTMRSNCRGSVVCA